MNYIFFYKITELGIFLFTVYKPKGKTCAASENLEISAKVKYISSLVTKDSSCGFQNSPWILKARAGQRISLSLLDFSWDNSTGSVESVGCNKNYGYILDIETNDITNICGGTRRERNLYTSSSSSVQIVFNQQSLETSYFILSFKGENPK